MYLDFEKFCLQESGSYISNIGQNSNGHVVYQSWLTPSFQVAILSREVAAQELEPRDTIKKHTDSIKRGDEVEVFDMNKKKNIKGTYISGIKDSEGNYTSVTLLVDGKTIQLQSSEVDKVK